MPNYTLNIIKSTSTFILMGDEYIFSLHDILIGTSHRAHLKEWSPEYNTLIIKGGKFKEVQKIDFNKMCFFSSLKSFSSGVRVEGGAFLFISYSATRREEVPEQPSRNALVGSWRPMAHCMGKGSVLPIPVVHYCCYLFFPWSLECFWLPLNQS